MYVFIVPHYVPSALNPANVWSRQQVTLTEASLDQCSMATIWKTFLWIDSAIDWMASAVNKQCQKFISEYPQPGASGVDIFVQRAHRISPGFLQPSVAYDPQSFSLSGGGDEIRGSSRGSIPSAETMVAQVPVFGATHDHNLSSNLSSSRRSNDQGTSAYDVRVALQDYLRLGGTSAEELETHMKALGEQTFKRYNRAWLKFLALASSKRSFTSIRDLGTIQISSLAYWLILLSEKESFAEARCAYAALLLFSGAQALRFEPILEGIKKRWNYSVPRYVVYHDVSKLLQQLPYLETRTESQVRLRLILVLRFFALFCGIDLERTKHTGIIKQGKVWFVQARRKGRPVYEPSPIHAMSNRAYCPIYWLGLYLEMTSSYEGTNSSCRSRLPGSSLWQGRLIR